MDKKRGKQKERFSGREKQTARVCGINESLTKQPFITVYVTGRYVIVIYISRSVTALAIITIRVS